MKSTFNNKISDKVLYPFNKKETFELAKKLEVEIDGKNFNILNCDLLRSLVINRPELTFDYIHLFDQEPFDEN